MELRELLRAIRRGWHIALACVVVGTALGLFVTIATTKVYQASVQLFVATSAVDSAAQLQAGNTFTQDRVQSYTSIASSPSVTDPVIKQLDLALSDDELSAHITADAPPSKVLVNVHVTDTDPRQAARIANAVADQFSKVVEETERVGGTGHSVVKLTVIHPATVPSSPIAPNEIVDIGLGFCLGCLVGLGAAVVRDAMDTTVKGPHDIDALGIPLLGSVPFDRRAEKTPIAFRSDPHGVRSEAYRQMRTNMQFVDIDNPPRIIAVTSAIPGEGKTTTAINLAAALAEAGNKVCLVEADLRKPSLARALGLVGDVGFTTVLIGMAPVDSVLQTAGRNLSVLTSGPVPPNPSELLISDHARAVIASLAADMDYVVIDNAPLLPVTDGAQMATIADATLLVHRAGKTTKDQVSRAIEALHKVGEKPVGIILNMVTRQRGKYDAEYGYYYTYRPDRPGDGSRATRSPIHKSGVNAGAKDDVKGDATTASAVASKGESTRGGVQNSFTAQAAPSGRVTGADVAPPAGRGAGTTLSMGMGDPSKKTRAAGAGGRTFSRKVEK